MKKTKIIEGDDGLPATEVHSWVKEKHKYLQGYIDISRGVRKKWLGPQKGGANFVDFFACSGRARIIETGEWVDGSAVAAWKISQKGGAPFSKVFIADIDDSLRQACAQRLRLLGAPVQELQGDALNASAEFIKLAGVYSLNFAFIDPYNLGALDFSIPRNLSSLKYIDMLIHISDVDIQRNTDRNFKEESSFDIFAPGWREKVQAKNSLRDIRRQVVDHWRDLIVGLGVWPSAEMRKITGQKNQNLYRLLLAAKNDIALKFWKIASNPENQTDLFSDCPKEKK